MTQILIFLKSFNFQWSECSNTKLSDCPISIFTNEHFMSQLPENSTLQETFEFSNLIFDILANFHSKSAEERVQELRRLFAKVHILKRYLFNHFNMQTSVRTSPVVCIQKWWRKLQKVKKLDELKSLAAHKIEAWWIATILRRRIKTAVESASRQNIKFEKDDDLEDFDFDTFDKELDIV